MYPDSLRMSAADVADIPVPARTLMRRTGQPAMVPLSQVAEIRAGVGPQQIERRSLERQISINAGVLPGTTRWGPSPTRSRDSIATLGLPVGYHTVFTGDVQNLDETKGFVSKR